MIDVTITDADPSAVEYMAAGDLGNHPRVTFGVEGASAINAHDKEFDMAVFALRFHYLSRNVAAALISEATRVARTFAIMDWRRRHPSIQIFRLPFVFMIKFQREGFAIAHHWLVCEFQAYSPAALSELSYRAGPNNSARFGRDRAHQFAVFQRAEQI